jgi:hypothetical protein
MQQGNAPVQARSLPKKKITTCPVEISVSITPEMKAALALVAKAQGMRPSQFGRQAIYDALVATGALKPPGWPDFEQKAG